MARPKDISVPNNSLISSGPVLGNNPDRINANPEKIVKEGLRKAINTVERERYGSTEGIVIRVEQVSRPASLGPYSDKEMVNKYFEGETKFYVLITRIFRYNRHIPYDPGQLLKTSNKSSFGARVLTQRMETKVYAPVSEFTDGIPEPGDYIRVGFINKEKGTGAVYRGTIAKNMNADADDGDSTEPCDDVRASLQKLLDSRSEPVASEVAASDVPDEEGEELVEEGQGQDTYEATYQLPISDVITSDFGPRERNGVTRQHRGTDIRAAIGTPIRAPYGGVIANVNQQNQGSESSPNAGYVMWLDTDPIQSLPEWNTVLRMKFFHLSEPDTILPGYPLGEGTVVSKGDIIAYSGNSNGTSGGGEPHLHWEVIRNGTQIDPMLLPGVVN